MSFTSIDIPAGGGWEIRAKAKVEAEKTIAIVIAREDFMLT